MTRHASPFGHSASVNLASRRCWEPEKTGGCASTFPDAGGVAAAAAPARTNAAASAEIAAAKLRCIRPPFLLSLWKRRSIGSDGVERRDGRDRLELEEQLAELDGLGVAHVDRAHDAGRIGLDLVHELHRLENAERLSGRDGVALLHEGRRARLRRAVEDPDHRRLDAEVAVRGGTLGGPALTRLLLCRRGGE